MIKTGGVPLDSFRLPGKELEEYIYAYNASFNRGKLQNKTKEVSADLFLPFEGTPHKDVTIDSDDKFDLKTTAWEKLRKYGLFSKWEPDKTDVSPIQEVTSSLLLSDNLSDKLLIDDSFVGDFRSYAMTQSGIGKVPFVFHFATGKYLTRPGICYQSGKTEIKDIAYLAQENVYMDFTIIELTFNREGVYTVIPVVSSPIDIFNDITSPPSSDWNIEDLIKAIVGIILLVLLLVVLAPILPYLLKAVVWVVTLPFKAVGALIKAVKKKE